MLNWFYDLKLKYYKKKLDKKKNKLNSKEYSKWIKSRSCDYNDVFEYNFNSDSSWKKDRNNSNESKESNEDDLLKAFINSTKK